MAEKINVVTGAKGYLGYALVKELAARGEKIRVSLHSDSSVLDEFGVEKYIGDVCDPVHLEEAFAGADTVYHVAGVIDITGTKDDLVWRVNYEGTKTVVEVCKKCGVKNLVFVSSVDAIKAPQDGSVIREPEKFDPDEVSDMYAKAKAAATQYVLDSSDENLKCCAVMPSCCIGPDDIFGSNSVCAMIRLIMKGVVHVSMDFGGYNFVDVRDVAKGMTAAAEIGKGGESYFLCGERMSIDDFISTLFIVQGKKPPKIKVSKGFLMKMLPLIGPFFKLLKLPPVITEFSLNKVCENCNFSNEKARAELGFEPMTDRQSLKDTVDWLKEHPVQKKKSR